MKFAVLNTDTLQNEHVKGETNVGAVYMTRAIVNIYTQIGVFPNEVVELKTCELSKYEGEKVLLPICIHIPRAYENDTFFNMAADIIPIFLSISMTQTRLSKKQIDFLKKHGPIGCRDSQTFHTMQKYTIDSYLVGCYVATFPTRNAIKADKIVFSDVPQFAKKYVPDEIKKNIIYIKQELLLSELPTGVKPNDYATNIFHLYEAEAKMIVSSRFHAAVLALAMGIPYILINEAYTYRFSWLKKMPNYYTRENIDLINWNPKPIDFTRQKELMVRIAKYRIYQKVQENEALHDRTKKLNLPDMKEEVFRRDAEELFMLLEDSEWEQTGQIDYCEGAIAHIEKYWSKCDTVRYALWGINNNAEILYQYIQRTYPKAILNHIYDINKNVQFHGMKSELPDSMQESNEDKIFVTTFVAKDAALILFKEKDIRQENYYICERGYISSDNL